jgi:hypothetical protein
MVDMVVHRHALRETLGRLVRLLTGEAAIATDMPALPKPANEKAPAKAAGGKAPPKAEAASPAG